MAYLKLEYILVLCGCAAKSVFPFTFDGQETAYMPEGGRVITSDGGKSVVLWGNDTIRPTPGFLG